MNILLVILLILICLVLSFFVLIQNPKGGGLSGTFGGFGGQVMGVKKSTDAVEKGTWFTIGALVLFTLLSFVMADRSANNGNVIKDRKIGTVQTQNLPKTAPNTQPQATPGQANPVQTQPQQAQPVETKPAQAPAKPGDAPAKLPGTK